MAEGLRVTSTVRQTGSIAADLEAMAEETVTYIKTMPGACPECVVNAQEDEPTPPRLHYGCRCELVTTTVSEMIRDSA